MDSCNFNQITLFLKYNYDVVCTHYMTEEKNEIEKLIDTMISNGDNLLDDLKHVLPDSFAETMEIFHESNVTNLKKIKEFLNK